MVLQLFYFVLFANIYFVTCIRQSSLTFVIDDTLSMYAEIAQVKAAAEGIMKVVIEEKASEIEDVVLVTFNDPEVVLRKTTSNSIELISALNNITIHNYINNDCEEYSLSGIELALRESRPNSYLFVFTDASAKDYYKVNEIKSLCEKKQSQVIFVLTGDCDSRSSQTYTVYRDIAQASSGQLFNIRKNDVRDLISTIRETVRGKKTVVTWKVLQPSYNMQLVKFTVDDKTDYVIISTSGFNIDLHVTNSSIYDHRIPLDKIFWNRLGKVVKMFPPSTGVYFASVRGDSEIAIVVYARTEFTFEHGFSEMVPKSLSETSKQPIAGRREHLSILVTDPEHEVVIKTARIIDMSEATLAELPLINTNLNFYITDKFVAPRYMFKIMITGTVNGNSIERVSRTAIEHQNPPKGYIKPKAPEIVIIKGAKADIDYNGEVTLTCKVSAYPAPKIIWTSADGTILNSASHVVELPYDYISHLKLSNVKSSGNYFCIAANDQRSISSIYVNLLPPIRHKTKNTEMAHTSVNYGKDTSIVCDLTSSLPIRTKWFYERNMRKSEIINSEKYKISEDGSTLHIKSVEMDQVGKYTCQATLISNQNFRMTSTTDVTINDLSPPIFEGKASEQIYERSKNRVIISCKIAGRVPRPTLSWQVKNNGENIFKDLSVSGEELKIKSVTLEDAGQYRCVAKNFGGEAIKTTDLIVLQAPTVFIENRPVTSIPYRGNYELTCKIIAFPLPNIFWTNGRGNKLDSQSVINNNVISSRLQIYNAKVSDTYECYAENTLGRVSDKVRLEVSPAIYKLHKQTNDITSVQYGAESTINCDLISLLPIKIEWYHESITGKRTIITNSGIYQISQSGSVLKIKSTELDHVGKYTCEAILISDPSVKMTLTTDVKINDLSSPDFQNKAPEMITIRNGNQVKLSCKISKGVPRPTVSWQIINNSNSVKTMSVPNKYPLFVGEELIIEHASSTDAGRYQCSAKNDVGQAVKTIDVIVEQAPIINIENVPKKSIAYGSDYEFTCEIKAVPLPYVVWKDSKGNKLNSQSVINNNVIRSRLQIYNAKVSDTYECYAENTLGRVSDKVRLEVSPAIYKLHKQTNDITSVQYGAESTINCDLISLLPIKIEWYHESITGKRRIITNSGIYQISQSGSVLKIKSTELDHVGKYTCEAILISDPSVKMTLTTDVKINDLNSPDFQNKAPEMITIRNGNQVKLSCKISKGVPRPTVSWQIINNSNSVQTMSVPNKYPLFVGEELIIEHASSTDAGRYQCSAKNDVGQAVKTIDVIVEQAPIINIENVPKKSIAYGSDYEFTCEIKAVPLPYVVWKDSKGNKLNSQSVINNNVIRSRLKIYNAKVSDTYECYAENTLGRVSDKVRLEVSPAICKVHKQTNDITSVQYGAESTINCDLISLLPIKIAWYHESITGKRTIITNSGIYQISKSGSVLKIKSTELDHVGKYTCEAILISDPSVKMSLTSDVKINDLSPPVFQNKAPEMITVRNGHQGKLSCKIGDGVPRPTVSWQYKKTAEDHFSDLPATSEVLSIDHASLTNAGFYRCIVKNSQGEIDRTTELVVPQDPIALIDGESKITVPYGSTNNLSCKVTAYPLPKITWRDAKGNTLNNMDISTKDHVVYSRLKIENIKDNNTFICHVENSLGSTESKVDVTVSSPFVVHEHPEATTSVHYGKPKQLICDISSVFPLKRKWYYQSQSSKTTEIKNSDNFKMSPDGSSLKIAFMDIDLGGEYTCETVLVDDDKQKLAFTTDVQIDNLRAPEINNTENVYYGVTGDEVLKIPCNATGVPNPTITWKQDDKLVIRDKKISIKKHAINIKNPTETDSKKYTCEAKNAIGAVKRTFEAIVTKLVVPQDPIALIDGESKITVPYGSTNNLSCKVTAYPLPKITWRDAKGNTLNNMDISTKNHVVYSHLKIENIKDNNTFICHVENSLGSTESKVDVTVSSPFVVHEHPEATTSIHYGKPKQLICDISSVFPLKRKWYYQSQSLKTTEIKNSDNFKMSPDGSSLKIAFMDIDLGGKYTCETVLVDDDKQKLAFTTDVQIDNLRAPEINNTENVYHGVTGDEVLKIPCNATGVPNPTITWKQDDKLVIRDKKISIKKHAINIKNPTETDSKKYTCEAKNAIGAVKRTFEAIVTNSIYYDKDKNKYIYLLLKESKDIICEIQNIDPKSIQWYFNGDITPVRGSIYPLKNVSYSNDGNYTCRMSTKEGATSQNYVVDVGYKPSFIIHNTSPVVSWNGNKDHMLDCSVNAKPTETDRRERTITEMEVLRNKINTCFAEISSGALTRDDILLKAAPVVKWYFNGKPLDTKDSSFNELPVTDWGKYTCKVSNVHGSIEQSFDVTYLGCLINRTVDNIQNSPLLLTNEYKWPQLTSENEFLTMNSGDTLTMLCSTDEQPNNPFKKHPMATKIEATCHKEDQFLVDGNSFKFNELKCTDYIKASSVDTGEPCHNGKKIVIGFKLDSKVLDAYDVCYDEARQKTLYTKVVMTDTNLGNKIESFSQNQGLSQHGDIVKCQYNQRYFVSPQDVVFGPAPIATLSQQYNAIQIYEPCEGSNMATWSYIEKTIRASTGMFDSITVWTGGRDYGTNGVPRYLWKVLQYDKLDIYEPIVFVNVPDPKKSDILCKFEALNGIDFNVALNTYTCSFQDFLQAFNMPASIFD